MQLLLLPHDFFDACEEGHMMAKKHCLNTVHAGICQQACSGTWYVTWARELSATTTVPRVQQATAPLRAARILCKQMELVTAATPTIADKATAIAKKQQYKLLVLHHYSKHHHHSP
jgi:hypothetical protein